MEKIITITLNPSIDKSTSVKTMVPDKKLSCDLPVYEPGGGGINVSRAIAHLGGRTTAVYLAGGYTGDYFHELIAKENIDPFRIRIEGHTRENMMVVDSSTNRQYRFDMQGPFVKKEEWEKCFEILEQNQGYEYVVASGSLPPGVPLDFFGQIAAIIKKQNARLIVDTSGEALKQAVNEGVFMIKPNLNELSGLYGKDELQAHEIIEAARSVIQRKGCEVMVVSMGAAGALLVTAQEEIKVTPPDVKIKSTVGAGDSMVAGMIFALSQNRDWKSIVQYGVACGTAATMNEGTALCKKEDVDRLFAGLQNQ